MVAGFKELSVKGRGEAKCARPAWKCTGEGVRAEPEQQLEGNGLVSWECWLEGALWRKRHLRPG